MFLVAVVNEREGSKEVLKQAWCRQGWLVGWLAGWLAWCSAAMGRLAAAQWRTRSRIRVGREDMAAPPQDINVTFTPKIAEH
ncbi:hypothetical protein E2C01_078140 [Portunus trituberculatus]|uniref:Uncharacterized protein n=1 Tax=Portunus trituberculatus TaxID=210409 RepID=A0A5B7IG78_PORTR|nr:hypothetical protein [Portunus trituberculatus]